MATPPSASEMFSDAASAMEVADRFEMYKAELSKSFGSPKPLPGSPGFDQQEHGGVALAKALGTPEVAKALSPELVDSVRSALADANIVKDVGSGWTVGTGSDGIPVSTGLVAFDLEAPAKLLTPRPTPLRNRIPRKRGIGLAHRFKVISGFTGTGTGGVGIFHPGITEGGMTSQGGPGVQFGGPTYLRGAKIEYNGYDKAVNYKQFSVSDSVSWAAQYSGQGYQDVRQLSQTTLLYSSMLLEERMLLGGRGTDSGFAGAVQPTISVATRAANTDAGEAFIPSSSITTNVWVLVVGQYMWGHSAISAIVSPASAPNGTSQVLDVTVTNAGSSGALSYDVYVGTGASAPAPTAMWKQVSGTGSVITVQGTLATSGTAASTVGADTSAYATGYDGILSYCCGPESGYVSHVNGKLTSDSAFQDAFASLYDSVKADPDELFANGNDRRALSDILKNQSSVDYQINLINAPGTEGAHAATLGALAVSIQNQITGKTLPITVHPWMPQGTVPIVSWTLPLPDSNVSDVWAVYNVADYTGIEWPVNQFLYESSSYWYGTFICYAPGWNAAVMGIEV